MWSPPTKRAFDEQPPIKSRCRAARMIGLTHGLILHHAPTIANLADALVTLLALLLTLALAALSYECFEKPIVAMGRALHYQESKKLLHAWSISQMWHAHHGEIFKVAAPPVNHPLDCTRRQENSWMKCTTTTTNFLPKTELKLFAWTSTVPCILPADLRRTDHLRPWHAVILVTPARHRYHGPLGHVDQSVLLADIAAE
jgi:hypothetical protein